MGAFVEPALVKGLQDDIHVLVSIMMLKPKKENVLFPVTLPTLIFWGFSNFF